METGPPSAPTGFIVGVDIGGSKIAAGLVTPAGEIRYHTRVAMLPNDGPDAALATVIKAIDQVCAKAASSGCQSRLSGVGICCPGPLDPKNGVIINPPNLPCWRDFALVDEISQKYKVPVKVDNDANAAALAEYLWGAGRCHPTFSWPSWGRALERELSSMAAFITDAPARPEKAATSASIIAARCAGAASRVASKHLPRARRSRNARAQNSAQ
jgi:ROK family